jgi:DNA polymerase-3 subunit delta
MILKFYEIEKVNLELHKFLLLYGKNEGLKNEIIKKLISYKENTFVYDEKEILDNQDIFYENTLSNSLFEKHKTIIIKRSTDKIFKIIEELIIKDVKDVLIILNADNLEKKSRLRSFFEKDKKLVCVPFYPDNDQVLSKLTYDFLRNKNITMSSANINLITNKCNGDREFLMNELHKIELFCKNGKKINNENLLKLINLNENHSISELIDNCLAQNKKKIINILNENNFSNDDCIMITRSFIIKAKKLLALSIAFETNKNMDLTISSAKPPIFWKEKEIIKQQIYKWKPNNIKKLIYSLSSTELQIKKNINNSINLITDFILHQSSSATNN